MPIRILPPELASKIAAGEVVERPASVVKELVENSIDAGASEIRIEVRDGGRRLIRVVDDGCGIPAEEVELAFARHATSKIASVEDLFHIETLGFRGEALASIAAVSRVTMITRPGDQPLGVLIRVEGGKVTRKEPRGCPAGTSVSVENLFYNVPARRKFLRHPSTEMSHISRVVTHYALAYPELKFSLLRDGKLTFQTSGSGALRDVIFQVFGTEVASQMLEVSAEEKVASGLVKVEGFVSPPSIHRPNRSQISFFVNRRWVQDALLTRALMEAYHTYLPSGRYPVVVLGITLDPALVDVNVHPTKREIRFKHPGDVFAAVQKAVRRVLTRQAPVAPFAGTLEAEPVPAQGRLGLCSRMPIRGRQGTPASPAHPKAEPAPVPPAQAASLVERLPVLRVLGQIGLTYIVAEGPDGMYLIDQHSAHERVLYEKLSRRREGEPIPSQKLLEPVAVELTPQQEDILEFLLPSLRDMGFELEEFGPNTWLVRAVPAPLTRRNVKQAVVDFIEELAAGGTPHIEGDRLIATLACHSAVRAGEQLTMEEMRQLIREMEELDVLQTCPHGRPTVIRISVERLAREFGRT